MNLFAAIALPLCLLQLQPPAPGTRKLGSPSQQHGSENPADPQASKNEPAPAPTTLNQPTCVIYEERSENGSGKSVQSSSSNGWITFFTFIIAIAGVLQFVAMWLQRGYMRKQWQTMKGQLEQAETGAIAASDNAIAAKISADAAINAQRAWMRAGLEYGSTNQSYDISVRNDGKTPGRIVGYSLTPYKVDLTLEKNPELKEGPVIDCNVWVNGGDSPSPINKSQITLFNLAQEVEPDPSGFSPKVQVLIINLVVYYVPMIQPGTKDKPNIRNTSVLYEWRSGRIGLKPLSTNYE